MTRRVLLAVLVLGLWGTAMADLPQGRRGKLLSFRDPGLEFIANNPEVVDRSLMDGLNIRAVGREGDKQIRLESSVFSEKAIRYEQFEEWVAQARATDFRGLTDNFLCVYVVPGDMDWFGDCTALLNNIRVAARVAREAGFKGICLDCEPYSFKLWDYRVVAHPEKSFEEYYEQIRLRGEQFAKAMYEEFPGMQLLLLFGYYVGDLEVPAKHHYGLYPAFLDGLFVGSPEDAEIIDGWEMSYGVRTREELLRAYWWIKDYALSVTRAPKEYQRKVRVGFGLRPDLRRAGETPYDWSATDFSRNYYTPEEWESVVRAALEISEGYVWLFSSRVDFVTGENLYPEYREAMLRAKSSLHGLSLAALQAWAAWPRTEEFAKEHELIAELPEKWQFRLDPAGAGKNWYFENVNDEGWLTVRTGEQWSAQVPFPDITGVGWGRVRFEVPAEYVGRRLYLWFGAIDEQGEIYLNGRHVYTWTGDLDRGWCTPFRVEITDYARAGTNLLAVKVKADSDMGGVYRPVYLYTDR